MGNAKLEVLGFEVPISLFSAYHDDGFVQDVYEHTRNLNRFYGTSPNIVLQEIVDKTFKDKVKGSCRVGRGILRKHVHIYYLDLGNDYENIEIRAHEETHALSKFGRLDLLENALRAEQGVDISLDSLDPEIVACLGELYALNKRHLFPHGISRDGVNINRIKASRLYHQKKMQEPAP